LKFQAYFLLLFYLHKPVKRQPNLPNAPPPQQANPNQLSEEELARQKDLEMSVSFTGKKILQFDYPNY